MATPSHRLKLYRADQHIEHIESIAEPLRERHEYPAIESMQSQRKGGHRWDYRLDLSSEQPPEMLPILIGDYLFNVRRALDHLIVAIAPRKYRHKVSFPILTRDPLASDKTGRDYLDAEAAARWLSLAKCLPDDCITALKALQPGDRWPRYTATEPRTMPSRCSAPSRMPTSIRELVNTLAGLSKVELHLDGEITYVVPIFQNRTIVVRDRRKVDVKVKGVPLLGLARGGHIWTLTCSSRSSRGSSPTSCFRAWSRS